MLIYYSRIRFATVIKLVWIALCPDRYAGAIFFARQRPSVTLCILLRPADDRAVVTVK